MCYDKYRHPSISVFFFFFFNDTATTEIYTLSLHDVFRSGPEPKIATVERREASVPRTRDARRLTRSEEHTSELQSRRDLVCRLLLEKKKKYCFYPRLLDKYSLHCTTHHHQD